MRIEYRSAGLIEVRSAERIIRMIAAPYDESTQIRESFRTYRESIARGAFEGADDVPINREHNHDRLVGKTIELDHGDARGLIATAHIAETPLGDETLALARSGVLGASVGMLVNASDGPVINGRRYIRRAELDHIALTARPAYRGARVLAVRGAS